MVLVCDDVDGNSPIFSSVGSSDDVESTSGDEFGDCELSYLHNVYQGELLDSMLPDAPLEHRVASSPCSLSMDSMPLAFSPASSVLKANIIATIALKNPASNAQTLSQRDTTPGESDITLMMGYLSTEMPSPRGASPMPTCLLVKNTPVRASARSRKRKGASSEAPALSSPAATMPLRVSITVTASGDMPGTPEEIMYFSAAAWSRPIAWPFVAMVTDALLVPSRR